MPHKMHPEKESSLTIHKTTMPGLTIPEHVGVMILPDCVLFPHGGLPLNIFEPRYKEMLDDALESSCFFAVTRMIGDETDNPADYAASVGTIGMIRASRVLEDGTSNLLLHGVIRVRFLNWLPGKSYPYAEIEPIPAFFEPADQATMAVNMLRDTVQDAIVDLPDEVQKSIIDLLHRTDDPVILSDIVSQQFIHDIEQRQMLLETESPAARISWLCQVLQRDK